MKYQRLLSLAFLVSVTSCHDKPSAENTGSTSVNEGLFVPTETGITTESIEDGFFVTKTPAERVNIQKVGLRTDTENTTTYWLEFDIDQRVDAGGVYVFRLGGKNYSDFRSNSGERWKLKFTDLVAARKFLKELAMAYKLPEDAVKDNTLELQQKATEDPIPTAP